MTRPSVGTWGGLLALAALIGVVILVVVALQRESQPAQAPGPESGEVVPVPAVESGKGLARGADEFKRKADRLDALLRELAAQEKARSAPGPTEGLDYEICCRRPPRAIYGFPP